MAKNVIIKQKKSETEVVDIYPKTESNIVVNNSTNITGSTVKDAFDNALPLTAGEHISINPSANGVEIAFTGSLAPNVSVSGETNNPVEVTGIITDTLATYEVKHKTSLESQYTKTASTASIIGKDDGTADSQTIKIPKIEVDTYGHVTAAEDEDVTIKIPSVANMVTGAGLTENKIILGGGNSTIKTNGYGISANLNASNPSTNIPTVYAVKTYVDNKITNSVQYLGVGTAIDNNTGKITGMDAPNSTGDWGRVTQEFNVPANLSSSGTLESAHVGDIVICTELIKSDPLYKWDVIHTEVDTDTWRPVQINGTSIDSSNIHPTLNLEAGDNISLSHNGGEVTIRATDTTYTLTQDTSTKNKFTFTPVGKTGTTITIDNVANAVNATTAKQVANALTVQFNGTNQFTYNGSAAKTLNITASGIGAAAGSHSHGNITNGGTITSTASVGNGDNIVIVDKDNNKIVRSSIAFNGSISQALSGNGTWETFLKSNENITINSGLKHKELDSDENPFIISDPNPTQLELGNSGINKGIYSAIEVNAKGIAIAGSQVIQYYTKDKTDDYIKKDTNLASGGFAFVEIA